MTLDTDSESKLLERERGRERETERERRVDTRKRKVVRDTEWQENAGPYSKKIDPCRSQETDRQQERFLMEFIDRTTERFTERKQQVRE